ncbi:MAG: phosphonoacetaldehyde hydrolase [Desulfobulbus propionicus]|nr:MAG: phosphonoacetaldehyde hydrolase [Desulfobulbus propionicus]
MRYSYTRSYCGPVQLVVFDWAGTTVDFGCQAPIAAFVEGFRSKGIELSMEQARGPMGMEKRDHIQAVMELDDVAAAWQAHYGRPANDSDIDAMYTSFVDLLMQVLPSHSQVIPGVVDVVAALRDQGVKIAATTGYFREAAAAVAGSAAQQGYVPDVALSSSDVHDGRPAPWLIYRVMEQLNIYPAVAVVNVGDTVVDIESGLNAGVWSIGVAATGNETGLSEEEFLALEAESRESRVCAAREKLVRAGAHYVIDTIDELPAVVDEINALLLQGGLP